MTPTNQVAVVRPATRSGRLAILGVAFVLAAAACAPAAPAHSADPAKGVTVTNGSDAKVVITYSQKDSSEAGTSEPIGELDPGAQMVVDSVLGDRPTICRVGRLIARTPDGVEVDRLELVCKGHSWTIGGP
jgi:hypothetical protein